MIINEIDNSTSSNSITVTFDSGAAITVAARQQAGSKTATLATVPLNGSGTTLDVNWNGTQYYVDYAVSGSSFQFNVYDVHQNPVRTVTLPSYYAYKVFQPDGIIIIGTSDF